MTWTYDPGTSTPGGLALVETSALRINDGSFVLSAIGGLSDTPDVRASLAESAEGHGGYLSSSFYRPRQITVEGYVLTDSLADLWVAIDYLKGAFNLANPRGSTRLFVKSLGWSERRFCDVRVAGPLVIAEPGRGSEQRQPYRDFQIPLVAPNPRLYGETVYDTVNHAFSNVQYQMVNEGSMPSPGQWIVDGPATNPSLIDDANARAIRYQGTVPSGSTLIVDLLYRTATLNGGNVYANLGQFDDVSVAAGGQTLRSTVTSGTGGWRYQHRSVWI